MEYTLTTAEALDHRATWVAALRSGVYGQGFGRLRTALALLEDSPYNVPGFCCLGVAEDARGCDWQGHGGSTYYLTSSRVLMNLDGKTTQVGLDVQRITAHLSGEGAAWLGLVTTEPSVAYRRSRGYRYEVFSLVELNDELKLSFAQIADVIEDQLPDWDGTTTFAQRDANARNEQLVS